jgi:hypothetical protein
MLASRNTNGTEHIVGTGYLGTVKQDTEVNLTGGEIYGSVYGGGKGTSAVAADIGSTLPSPPVLGGNTSVFLNGSTATGATNDCKVRGNIFGCNNINGTPKGHALVHIYKTVGYDDSHKKSVAKDNATYDLAAVYGGGNMAAYKPVSNTDLAEVIIDGCEYYPLFIFVGRIRSTIT